MQEPKIYKYNSKNTKFKTTVKSMTMYWKNLQENLIISLKKLYQICTDYLPFLFALATLLGRG